jgi:hypothetical protein
LEDFIEELAEACTELGEVKTSPDLRKSSLRMLKVTGGEWHKKYLIHLAFGEDYFTSRLARDFKIDVVTAVMETLLLL